MPQPRVCTSAVPNRNGKVQRAPTPDTDGDGWLLKTHFVICTGEGFHHGQLVPSPAQHPPSQIV